MNTTVNTSVNGAACRSPRYVLFTLRRAIELWREARRCPQGRALEHLPVLHHEADGSDVRDVLERICVEYQEIRALAFLDRADIPVDAHRLGRDGGGGP